MSAWLVTANERQFSVNGLSELKDMARAGRLSPGDLIQPPGAQDWIYASEVPELRQFLQARLEDESEDRPSALGNVMLLALAGLFALVLLGGVIGVVVLGSLIPDESASIVGEGGLSHDQLLVTQANAPLLTTPDPTGTTVQRLNQDQQLTLLAKRGNYYKARTKDNLEGWVSVQQVVPMYQLAGDDVQAKMDPLYNPDRYVQIVNSRWSQLPDQARKSVTVFQFMLQNTSQYDVTGVKLEVTIKDAQGAVVDKAEIPVEGIVPGNASVMVGTLKGEKRADPPRVITDFTLQQMAAQDQDVQLRYADGVELKMKAEEFTEAKIVVAEARALPPQTMVQ